jgi:two-component system, sensor histidine kinase PdtaS
MRHRIANSLQIIASILLMKAHSVQSRETRLHLQEAHDRILSLATLQNQLKVSSNGEQVEMRRYLMALCDSLETSITRGGRPITPEVHADPDMVMSSEAVSLGLMTTELVINALKHAFPGSGGGNIAVQYEVDAHGWHLSVADDGVGFLDTGGGAAAPGLGMSIVEALASRLDGGVEITNARPGTIVSVTASKPRC